MLSGEFEYVAEDAVCTVCKKPNNEFIVYKDSGFLGFGEKDILLVCQSCMSRQFRGFSSAIKTPRNLNPITEEEIKSKGL